MVYVQEVEFEQIFGDYKNRLWQKLIILYQMSISPSSEHSWNTFLSLSHS